VKRWVVALIIIIILSCILIGVLYMLPSKKYYEDIIIDNEQRIRIQLGKNPRTLDPQKASLPEDLTLICNLQDGILGISQDGEYVFGEGLGKSYEVEHDGLFYRFKLREAYWSDGTPITSEDFYYSWKRALDLKEEAPYGQLLHSIKNAKQYVNEEVGPEELGINIVDALVFEVELEEPDPNFLYKLIYPVFFPINYENSNMDDTIFDKDHNRYISSGPFHIDEWLDYDRITLSKNATYWDADNVVVEKLDFLIINEDIRIFEAFQRGELDIIEVSKNYKTNIEKSPGFYIVEEGQLDSSIKLQEFEMKSGQKEEHFRIGIIKPSINRAFVLPAPPKYHLKWSYVRY